MKVDSKALKVASLTMAMAVTACGSPAPVNPFPTGGTPTAPGPSPALGDQTEKPVLTPEAQQFFVDSVYPALAKDDLCGGCHIGGQFNSPIYLAGGAAQSYEFMHQYNGGALVAVPENNLLLLKNQHEGMALPPDVRGIVTQWLQLEYPDHKIGVAPKNVFQALLNAGQCLSKIGFQQNGLNKLFQKPTDGNCTCDTCHNKNDAGTFGGGVIFDADEVATFASFQNFPGMMIFVQGKINSVGAFSGLVQSNRLELKGTEFNILNQQQAACDPVLSKLNPAQNFGTYVHPSYTLTQDELKTFANYAAAAIGLEKMQQCNPDNAP